jgi:hypothetical protein
MVVSWDATLSQRDLVAEKREKARSRFLQSLWEKLLCTHFGFYPLKPIPASDLQNCSNTYLHYKIYNKHHKHIRHQVVGNMLNCKTYGVSSLNCTNERKTEKEARLTWVPDNKLPGPQPCPKATTENNPARTSAHQLAVQLEPKGTGGTLVVDVYSQG